MRRSWESQTLQIGLQGDAEGCPQALSSPAGGSQPQTLQTGPQGDAEGLCNITIRPGATLKDTIRPRRRGMEAAKSCRCDEAERHTKREGQHREEPASTRGKSYSPFSRCCRLLKKNKMKSFAAAFQKLRLQDRQRDSQGDSLLHHACALGSHTAVDFLLKEDVNGDINAQNVDGNTPLHLCYAYGYRQLAEVLQFNGGDPRVTNRYGLTAQHGVQKSEDPVNEDQVLHSLPLRMWVKNSSPLYIAKGRRRGRKLKNKKGLTPND